MKSNWKEERLGSLVRFSSGGTPNKNNPDYWNGTIPWISAKNMKSEVIETSDLSITEEGLIHGSKIAPKGSLLLLVRGSGLFNGIPVCYLENAVAYNQDVKCIESTSELENKYLFYWLKANSGYLRKKIEFTSIGAGKFDTRFLSNLVVRFPDKVTRKKIIDMADNISDRININKKINENLLQQAGAVFDKYYNTSSNQQLFTSLINVLGGGTPKTGNPYFWDGSIPFFTPKDVGAPYTFQTEKYITESGLEHCNSRLYPKNTTFVTARGTVGKVSLAGTPMAMNQSCYALASKTIDPLLVYFYALKAVASLKHKASGAVFDAIVTRDFDTETINILTDEDARSALSVIAPAMEAIHNNVEENMRLSKLRDTLLPNLMSGKLDVSELDL